VFNLKCARKGSEAMSVEKFGLRGVRTYDIQILPDERGFFAEALRKDWNELLMDEWIAQANISFSYPGIVRAWHRHVRGQDDYFLVMRGAMKICAYDDEERSDARGHLTEIVASGEKPQIVKIPGHYWHGTKTIGHIPSLTVYFVTRLYDYEKPDEERRPWNDSTVVPTAINGRVHDPRVGKPWDWFHAPHK